MTGTNLLKDLDIDRVDAVDRPAHKSQFLILKNEDAADLKKNIQGLADASSTLFDAVVKGDMNAIRAAARPLAAILEKDASTLPTQHDVDPTAGMAGGGATGKTAPETQADEVAEDTKTGDAVAKHGEVAGAEVNGKTAPEVQADDEAQDVKTGDDVAKFCAKCSAPMGKAFTRKSYITKAACPMCGAPCDTAGKYAEGGEAPAPAEPIAAKKGEVPAALVAHQFKPKGAKAEDEDEDKKDDEKPAEKPFDPSIFAKQVAEATAAAVAKSVAEAFTKFGEEQAAREAAPSTVTKSSRQAADGQAITKSGRTSFTDVVFGPIASPRA